MTAMLYETVILGRHADIQKGRKGQSLKQSLDEIAEDFKSPLVPYIESLGEVYDLLTPIIFQIHGNPKTKSALSKSLWHTLLLMARDKEYGAWVAQASFAIYLSLGDFKSAKEFMPQIAKLDEARVLNMTISATWQGEYLEEVAQDFSRKLALLKEVGIDLNGKFVVNRWTNDKTTIAQQFAANPPDDIDSQAYVKMLESAHYHGVDLVKAIPVAEEEESQEFVSFAMKLKLEQTTKEKPVVSRVSKEGGKV
ncbi:conserved hypothetical protein [Burkholderia cenocepacia]|nr:conserved hypothetical protein [Burkholderia cenocepacia]